ncbi:MAG: class I SAM-dependent methyltransferase [Methanobacteriota archaeon]|nr:MAG: class I SAM-dependent methyltransferase [Euryarchaeota archaeon]
MKSTDQSESIRSDEFQWNDNRAPQSHSYLAPIVLGALRAIKQRSRRKSLKVLDIGCGNGAFTAMMAREGFEVVGCDYSKSGIEICRSTYPHLNFFQQDINHPLPEHYHGSFDCVVSLEVIEHLFFPRNLFDRAKEALGDEGVLILSTPYHGYIKNLALALANKFDDHWHPLRDYGHIKFFSRRTLSQLVRECGFDVKHFRRVGRVPPLAKSMVIVAKRSREE